MNVYEWQLPKLRLDVYNRLQRGQHMFDVSDLDGPLCAGLYSCVLLEYQKRPFSILLPAYLHTARFQGR